MCSQINRRTKEMIKAQQLANGKIHKCDNCNLCGHEKIYQVSLMLHQTQITFTICKTCLDYMCREFRELDILMRKSELQCPKELFNRSLNSMLTCDNEGVFKFIGQDGSMGFMKNRLYRLRLERQSSMSLGTIIVASDVNSKKWCPYSSIDTFWGNWKYIRRG